MAGTEVKVTSHVDEIKEKMDTALERALEACGIRAEELAAGKCPVDTGFLRNSITFALDGEPMKKDRYQDDDGGQHGEYRGRMPKEPQKNARCVYVGTNIEYAPFVELGSSRQTPKPFLKPAVQDHKRDYVEIIEKMLKNGT